MHGSRVIVDRRKAQRSCGSSLAKAVVLYHAHLGLSKTRTDNPSHAPPLVLGSTYPRRRSKSSPPLLVCHPFRHTHLSSHRAHSTFHSPLNRNSLLDPLNMRTSLSTTTAIAIFLAMTGAAVVNAQLSRDEQASLVQCQQNSRCARVSVSSLSL